MDLVPLEGQVSMFSGHPSVVYQEDDLVVPLTPRELTRFVAHALTPTEFFALEARFGNAFSWHDDFYCANTGRPVQPMFEPADYPEAFVAEDEPPVHAWPPYQAADLTEKMDAMLHLAQHPMVASGHWIVRKPGGAEVHPGSYAKELTNFDASINARMLEQERRERMEQHGAAKKGAKP